MHYPYHSNANTSAPHFRGAWSPLFDDLLVQHTSELKISMLRASEKQNLENDDKPQRDIKVATRTKLPVSSRRALCWLIDFIIPVFTHYPAEAQTKAMAPSSANTPPACTWSNDPAREDCQNIRPRKSSCPLRSTKPRSDIATKAQQRHEFIWEQI